MGPRAWTAKTIFSESNAETNAYGVAGDQSVSRCSPAALKNVREDLIGLELALMRA
jgi:hypothetical protein